MTLAWRRRRLRRIYALAAVLSLVAGCARETRPLVARNASTVPTLIRNVAIFDGLAATRTPPRDVLLERGRITRIAPPGTLAPADALTIDGAGLTLLPGLIDMHGHVNQSSAPVWTGAMPDPERNMQSYLYCGVTTVLDPADLATQAFARRDAVARGELLGPRIHAAGPMFTTPGGHPVAVMEQFTPWWLRWYVVPRLTRQVATVEEARNAVAELATSRPDVIKVTVDAVPTGGPVIGLEVLRAVVEAARARRIRSVAHIGSVADALEAADAGVAAWVHSVYKERIPDELIPRFAAARIPVVATTVVFDSYADLLENKREATDLERETVAADVLGAFVPLPKDYDAGPLRAMLQTMADARQARRDNVRRLHAAGITILAGADAQSGVFPGPGLHRELGILVESGLTPAQALRAATGDAARFLADSDDPDFGVVAEGKVADLVLVEGDPTADITNVSRIRDVIQGGVRLERYPLAH